MKFFLIALLGILLFLQYKLWVDKRGMPHVARLKEHASQLKNENENLEKQNKALEVQVNYYKHDTKAYEERAREDLGMVKKGEVFYFESSH